MSFEIFKQEFGEITEFVIQENLSGNRFVVVPELGGIVRQLSLRKDLTLFSVLKTPPTPHTLEADTQSASALLFPFASRIPEGRYKFLGKEYQLAQNESGTSNAIHGLVRKQKFSLEEQSIKAEQASIKLSYSLKDLEGYPFDVAFTILYTLHIDGRFVLKYEATNIGSEPSPIMFGWHPYFHLGHETADAWKIKIPSEQIVDFDDNMIPIGSKPFTNDQPMLLYKKALDNCFIVKSNSGTAVTELISDNQHVTLHIEQESGEGKFKYLVVYTPPAKDCVAIEPLTSNVNAFNNGEGLNILAPSNSISGTITVSLS